MLIKIKSYSISFINANDNMTPGFVSLQYISTALDLHNPAFLTMFLLTPRLVPLVAAPTLKECQVMLPLIPNLVFISSNEEYITLYDAAFLFFPLPNSTGKRASPPGEGAKTGA